MHERVPPLRTVARGQCWDDRLAKLHMPSMSDRDEIVVQATAPRYIAFPGAPVDSRGQSDARLGQRWTRAKNSVTTVVDILKNQCPCVRYAVGIDRREADRVRFTYAVAQRHLQPLPEQCRGICRKLRQVERWSSAGQGRDRSQLLSQGHAGTLATEPGLGRHSRGIQVVLEPDRSSTRHWVSRRVPAERCCHDRSRLSLPCLVQAQRIALLDHAGAVSG